MSDALPVPYEWTGNVMRPRGPRALLQCDREYKKGHTYWLAEEHGRSPESHNHQFAWLHDAWLNLPEELAAEYPNPESLRKRALIQAGFYDEQVIDAGSEGAALRVASWARAYAKDMFIMSFVLGQFVSIRVAKSQSHRAMGKAEFQASKQAIIEIISEMIGVTAAELEKKGTST
jgi:hypothetical protein